MSRLPPINPEALTAAQSEVYRRIATGARGGVRGPFTALLHSPELASRTEQLGVYVRFQCAVPERLRELAILVVARHWKADYEWHAHAGLARRQGVPDAVVDAIGRGEAPAFNAEADAIVHAYVSELLAAGRVSEQLFRNAQRLLGDRGAVDLTGLVGYYSLLAMTLNAFEVAVPEGSSIPWHREGGPTL